MEKLILQLNKKKELVIFALSFLIIIFILIHNWTENQDGAETINSINIYNVQDFGASGDSIHDDTSAIQKALNKAKKNDHAVKVVVPQGTYRLTGTLRIYQNTHLLLEDGAVFLRSHNDTILMNGDIGDDYSSYDGQGDITIEGGIWEGNALQYPDAFNAIGIARANHLTIRDIEVRDVVGGHAIDLNSSNDVLIEDSKFLGYTDNTPERARYYSEAIQIAEHTKLGFSPFGSFDGTPNQNVTIRNNVFGSSGTAGTTAWPVGIGNHGSVHDHFNNNIEIYNNTFKGMTFVGVRIFKWKNTTIHDNEFLNCARGIAFSNSNGQGESSKTADGNQTGLPQSGSNVTISNNKFENTQKENIYIAGWPKGKTIEKVNNITVTNNEFHNQLGIQGKPNIQMNWVNNVKVTNNIISNTYKGMEFSYASEVDISGNQLKDIMTDAISVNEPDRTYQQQGYTTELSIRKNTISQFNGNAISLEFTNHFTIKENTIEASKIGPGLHVILAKNYSNKGEISQNAIQTAAQASFKEIEVTNTCNAVIVKNNSIQ